jgi:outer membrane protein OmpA-like peptidoglycan-associated protein
VLREENRETCLQISAKEWDVKQAWAFLAVLGVLAIPAPSALAQPQAPPPQQTSSQQSSPSQQTTSQPDVPKQESSPLYRVTVVARTTKAINYRHLSGSTKIDFHGTVLLPFAKGEAKVEGRKGAIRIQAQFEKLDPATRFGPEFLTYVLWAVSPEGRADNLGEIQIEGSKSKLDVTAQLQAFALIVTAEPYFAVTQPSEVVVLENIVRPDTMGSVEEIDAKFDLLQRSQYTYVQANSQDNAQSVADARIPLGLREARNAMAIAKAAGAERYAAESFQKASQLFAQAENYQAHKGDKKQLEMTAREAVQTAEDARAIAAKRREEERLAQERQAAAEREARAKAMAEQAEKAKLEAQLAAERAAREKAEAEAARLAAQAQQQAAQADAEKSRIAAEQAARERAAAEVAKAAAQVQQQAAQADAEKSRLAAAEAAAEKAQAQADAERARKAVKDAEAEKAGLRAQLLNQLNSILQTQDTARGLIVNMSDVLFDTGSFTLKAGAREKLAKISGVLLSHPGLSMQIEGHTDSVGSDDFNQQLSERRAGMVRDFLVDQGVAGSTITARGFGKTQPVATNDTPEGRQRNRRVELVVNGADIDAANSDDAKTQ